MKSLDEDEKADVSLLQIINENRRKIQHFH
jgi:hypothetical protein